MSKKSKSRKSSGIRNTIYNKGKLEKIFNQHNNEWQNGINALIGGVESSFKNVSRTITLDTFESEVRDIRVIMSGLKHLKERYPEVYSLFSNKSALQANLDANKLNMDRYLIHRELSDMIKMTEKISPDIANLNKVLEKVSKGEFIKSEEVREACKSVLLKMLYNGSEPLAAIINYVKSTEDIVYDWNVLTDIVWDSVRGTMIYALWANDRKPVYSFSNTYSTALMGILETTTVEDLAIFNKVPVWDTLMVQNCDKNKDDITSFAIFSRTMEIGDFEFEEVNEEAVGGACLDFRFFINYNKFNGLEKEIFRWRVPSFDMRLSPKFISSVLSKETSIFDALLTYAYPFSHLTFSELMLSIHGSRLDKTLVGKALASEGIAYYMTNWFKQDYKAGEPVESDMWKGKEDLHRLWYYTGTEIMKCIANIFSCYIKKNIPLTDTAEELHDKGAGCDRKRQGNSKEIKHARKLISVGFTESYACLAPTIVNAEHKKGGAKRPHLRRLHTKHVWVGKKGTPERHRELYVILPTYIHADEYNEELHGKSRKLINVRK